MTETAIAKIESVLGVRLPADYRSFLKRPCSLDVIDDSSVCRDPKLIIEATQEYRSGFSGLPPWPASLVYVGDESDACPYVIDCTTGSFTRTDKGSLKQPPLDEWSSFEAFVTQSKREAKEEVSPATQKKNGILFYVPAAIALIGIFVVLPAIACGVSKLWHAIFR